MGHGSLRFWQWGKNVLILQPNVYIFLSCHAIFKIPSYAKIHHLTKIADYFSFVYKIGLGIFPKGTMFLWKTLLGTFGDTKHSPDYVTFKYHGYKHGTCRVGLYKLTEHTLYMNKNGFLWTFMYRIEISNHMATILHHRNITSSDFKVHINSSFTNIMQYEE